MKPPHSRCLRWSWAPHTFVPLHVDVGVARAEDDPVRVAVELLSDGQHGNEVMQWRLSYGAADCEVGFVVRGYPEK